MSEFDLRTHRPCGHPRDQKIPVDVPQAYRGAYFCCLHKGVVIDGEIHHVDFDGETREPELGG